MTKIVEDVKLDFQDVLLLPKRSVLESRSQVKLERTYKFKHSPHAYTGLPVVVANMDTVGTIEMAKALYPSKMSVALHKFYSVEELASFFNSEESIYTFYTMGITDTDLKKFYEVNALTDKGIKYVCIDVANGYSRRFVHFVEQVRQEFPDVVIMAGNVVTPDMVYDLLERGADIVKVGIGSGSVCTTRKITGVGYPQLSAIMECADAAHGAGGLICGDGGITCAGDISKAFAAGADFVMSGGLFAGHDECGGQLIGTDLPESEFEYRTIVGSDDFYNRTKQIAVVHKKSKDRVIYRVAEYDGEHPDQHMKHIRKPASFFDQTKPIKMKFYGMSSEEAMKAHYGGKANYRASEGKVVEVDYKGPVANTIEEILGGLRSACTYLGAKELKHLPKCATFIKVNRVLNNVFG